MLDMRLTVNETTGEHTCVMLRELQTSDADIETGWLDAFTNGMPYYTRIFVNTCTDFKRRFITLLGFEFRRFPAALALTILKKEHYVELDSNSSSLEVSNGIAVDIVP